MTVRRIQGFQCSNLEVDPSFDRQPVQLLESCWDTGSAMLTSYYSGQSINQIKLNLYSALFWSLSKSPDQPVQCQNNKSEALRSNQSVVGTVENVQFTAKRQLFARVKVKFWLNFIRIMKTVWLHFLSVKEYFKQNYSCKCYLSLNDTSSLKFTKLSAVFRLAVKMYGGYVSIFSLFFLKLAP